MTRIVHGKAPVAKPEGNIFNGLGRGHQRKVKCRISSDHRIEDYSRQVKELMNKDCMQLDIKESTVKPDFGQGFGH